MDTITDPKQEDGRKSMATVTQRTSAGKPSLGRAQAAWNLIRTTFTAWQSDKAPKLGAALAYYTVFSLAPLLVIALAIAGLIFDADAANAQVQTQLQGMLGDEGAAAVEALLVSAQRPEAGSWAAIFGLITLLFGASGVFGELQDSLNTIWKVEPKVTSGFWRAVRARFFSFAMVLGVGFLLLVSLIVSAVLSGLVGVVGEFTGGSVLLMQVANVVVSLATITLLFAMIFKILPDKRIAWRDVWLGAAVTAILFTIGKQLIGMYLGRAAVGSSYGAAGSVVIVLLWAYYSAQILFLGAEFTHAYAETYGSLSSESRDRAVTSS